MEYGRYTIIEERGEPKELGEGAMGVVYLAFDSRLDSQVALKVLREDLVVNENIFQRFIKEAQVTRRVAHSNIVTVYDVGRDHGTIYIAMELVEGKSLDKAIKENRLTLKEILDIGAQIAGALDYAHQKGIVHRDIKPENIMWTSSGEVKITDFGIARIEDPMATQITMHGTTLGTPPYMSPEQTRAQPIDRRSDLFSLGIVLYELTTGKRPFKGENMEALFESIRQDKPKPPYKDDEPLPRCLPELILKSLQKNPNRRFQTGSEMKASLEACLSEIEKDGEPDTRPWIKILKRMAVFFGIVILVAGLAYIGRIFFEPRAVVKVNSTPPGAQVFIDGEFKGKTGETPLEIRLPLGKHEVRLSLNDYYEWEAQLELDEKDEEPLDIDLEPMEKKTPNIRVRPKEEIQ